ncbi:hypothetical protein CT0861_02673 [Colletotrichum tofieldiae]|uniref:Uncharacterized protein n=1 Tax=Colletotrichum tofieldiae TaxID=708197 RepID=A0A166NI91_9PEZI|nr:hypothetical protein CT0861_02673 [Colletotrichum tofieldiae]
MLMRTELTVRKWDFDTKATETACNIFRYRNTGSSFQDTYSNYRMGTHTMDGYKNVDSCFSFQAHLGGDEFDYCCGINGLQDYCKGK